MEHFPYKLRLARKAAGLTQEQLGGKLGLSRQAISRYERGLKKLDSTRLIGFATVLQQELDYFFTRPRLDVGGLTFRTWSESLSVAR